MVRLEPSRRLHPSSHRVLSSRLRCQTSQRRQRQTFEAASIEEKNRLRLRSGSAVLPIRYCLSGLGEVRSWRARVTQNDTIQTDSGVWSGQTIELAHPGWLRCVRVLAAVDQKFFVAADPAWGEEVRMLHVLTKDGGPQYGPVLMYELVGPLLVLLCTCLIQQGGTRYGLPCHTGSGFGSAIGCIASMLVRVKVLGVRNLRYEHGVACTRDADTVLRTST